MDDRLINDYGRNPNPPETEDDSEWDPFVRDENGEKIMVRTTTWPYWRAKRKEDSRGQNDSASDS